MERKKFSSYMWKIPLLLAACCVYASALTIVPADFNATGVYNGLEIKVSNDQTFNVTCMVDGDEDELISQAVVPSDPYPVEKSFNKSGYYDIYIACFGPTEIYTANVNGFYVGNSLSGIDIQNGSQSIAVPVFHPLTEDLQFIIFFANGSDVDINITLLHNKNSFQLNNSQNGSHTITIPKDEFPGSGLYLTEVTLTNPLSKVVNHTVIAIQQPIVFTGLSFPGYTEPVNYIMTGLQFSVQLSLSAGENVTFSMTIEDTAANNTTSFMMDYCIGTVSTHTISYTFTANGTYTITVTMSNYVSSHSESRSVISIYEVNDFNLAIANTFSLSTSDVVFTITRTSTAKRDMGTVNCLFDFGDGQNQTVFMLNASSSDLPKAVAHRYIASWYTATVKCRNQLPETIGSTTKTTMTFPNQVVVENPVNPNLQWTHNISNVSYHPASVPVNIVVTLKSGALPLANLTCKFNNANVAEQKWNFSSSNPLTVQGKFDGGNKVFDITANCSNFVDFMVLPKITVFVYWDCWENPKFFYVADPLTSYTNEAFTVTPTIRLTQTCHPPVKTNWTVTRTSDNAVIFHNVTEETLKVFPADTMPDGTYKVTVTSWFSNYTGNIPITSDFVNLKYTLPSLVPIIKVNNAASKVKIVVLSQANIIDTSESMDPADKQSYIAALPLNRAWVCKTGSALTEAIVLKYLENPTAMPPEANTNCVFSPTGVAFTIPSNTLTENTWYILALTLTRGSRTAVKSLALQAATGPPLDLEFKCITNCFKGSGDTDRLVLSDLQLNIRIITAGVENRSATIVWKIEVFNVSSYVDVTGSIPKNGTGFKFPAEALKTYDDKGLRRFRLICEVSAAGYSKTKVYQFYSLNLAPYDGTCSWSPSLPSQGVNAGIDTICYDCKDWKDEGLNSERNNLTDTGGDIQYFPVQVFYTEKGSLHSTFSMTPTASIKRCFKLVTPPKTNVTIGGQQFLAAQDRCGIEIHIQDSMLLPRTIFNMGNITIRPPVAYNASGSAGASQIDELMKQNDKDLQDTLATNDILRMVELSTTLSSALNIKVPEIPPVIPVVKSPNASAGGLNDIVDGKGVSFEAASRDLQKPDVDPTLAALRNTTANIMDNLNRTLQSQQESVKNDPVFSRQLAQAAISATAVPEENLNDRGLASVADVAYSVMQTANKNHTEIDDSTNTDALKEVITQMVQTVGAAIVPDSLSLMVADTSLAAERERSSNERLFASPQALVDLEEKALFTEEERVLMKSKSNQKIADAVQSRIDQAMAFSEKVDEFQKTSVRNAKIADGANQTIGNNDSFSRMTRDISEKVAGNPIQSPSTEVRLPGLKDAGLVKATVGLFEMNVVLKIDKDANAAAITSTQKKLIIDTEANMTENVKITHKIAAVKPQTYPVIKDPEDASNFTYMIVSVAKKFDDLHLQLKPTSSNIEKYVVYILYAAKGADSYVSKLKYTAKKECTKPDYVVRFTPQERGAYSGIYKVGIETIYSVKNGTTRQRREATNDNETLTVATATMACMTWSDTENTWKGDQCTGTWAPDTNELICDCLPMKEFTFANSFYVPPNKIDFSSVFLKFSPASQAAVMAVLIIVLVAYIILIIWARRQDRRDLLKWGITPLSDNFSEDNYFYVIKVFTGMRPGAGTKSRVSIVVSGDDMDTGIRELSDGVRHGFSTGSVMNFLMSTTGYLGDLDFVRVWHDNSGGGNDASWYISKIELHDVQRNETFTFMGERWLAIEKEDGLLECVLPVCKADNLNHFRNRFLMNTKDTLSENHIWVSVAYRPQVSNFTRVQRATCALVFVMLTMITNAMFFRGKNPENYETPAEVQIGPFRFTLQQIYISLQSALIVTAGTMILIYLFKLSRSKIDPNEPVYKPRDKKSRYKIPFMEDWLEKQQRQSLELERHLVQKGVPINQGFTLPHWCAYIAWILAIVAVILCAFFVMLYSMQWGKSKSEEWVTTFLLSFFESVFLLDPIQIGVMAVMFAIIFRSTKQSETPINRSTIMKKYSSSLRSKSGGMRLPPPPLDHEKLGQAREVRTRELLMKRAFRDVIINLLMIWILFSIGYSNIDKRSYSMYKEIKDTLLEPPGRDLPTFSKIGKTTDFYDWFRKILILKMFPETEIDGNQSALHWRVRQFIEGGTLFRVGPPRLRQVRTPREGCDKNPYFSERNCYGKYGELSEETGSYCIGWKDGPCDKDEELYMWSSEAWRFQSALDIWGIPVPAEYTTYGGGGYIAKLSVNRKISQDLVEELFNNSWVDRQTRAVMLEFTLYCLNANMFAYNIFMVEFPETGGALPYYAIYPLRVYPHQGSAGLYALACEVIFVIYLVAITIIIIINIVQQKKAYFKQPWQVFELVFVILGYVTIIMFIIQMVLTNQSLEVFRLDKKAFVNFYHIALWNMMFILLFGILVFMATIRMLNILGYNKRINTIVKVFSAAANDLLWFGLFFITIYLIYASFGYLLFGGRLDSYQDILTSMTTLFLSMIGKSRFAEIEESAPVFSKIYFMMFIFLMVYVILTMFLAMLSKAIDEVNADTKVDKKDEMVEYVLKKVKNLMSYGPRNKKSTVEPAPWSESQPNSYKHRMMRMAAVSHREILEEIRQSMQDALTSNPRDFSTPDAERKEKKVSFRN